jgi:two-component system, chemotaxis family, sensor kinase CheA
VTPIIPGLAGVWQAVKAMFITSKRHEREKQELIRASSRLTDAILKTSSLGLLLLDSTGKILPQVSNHIGALFRRQDFANLNFDKLIAPLVSAKTLSVVRNYVAHLLELPRGQSPEANPLQDVELRLPKADGNHEVAHYCIEFTAAETQNEPRLWVVHIADITAREQQHRELVDLRAQVRTQGEILRSVLQAGGTRFGAFLQRTDASMKTINNVLKKPAREAGAFRSKLEETLEEVDRIRRDAAALKLTGLQSAAREFEDALQELRSRESLSGSDFLPLAVKLDALFGQFASLRSLTSQAGPARDPEPVAPEARLTENGTQIIESPKFFAEMAQAAHDPSPAQRMAPAGSLESTLATLTDLVAQENHKTVVLECSGLQLVPARYQATIKNVAIQLIRNAVVHGIEPSPERVSARKPPIGSLHLEFKIASGSGFELLFRDDGKGLDPSQVRSTAVARGLLTQDEAERMRDRQAIKLIFKSGFTTMTDVQGESKHGSGMSLVRRYVHEAGGKIALASQIGQETRFKVTLPALSPAAPGAAVPAADEQVA